MTFPRRKVLGDLTRKELELHLAKMEAEISAQDSLIKELDDLFVQAPNKARVVCEEIFHESMLQNRITLLESAIVVVDLGLALTKSRTAN